MSNEWCDECNKKHFEDNFGKWTSKNDKLDEFLQDIQRNANNPDKVMEWIPYDRLLILKYIAEGGFGTVHFAIWLNGPVDYWNVNYKKWKRNVCRPVAIKILKDSTSSLTKLLEEVSCY